MARSADRALEKLPLRDRERVEQRIDALADDPRPPQCTRLVGTNPKAYRLRQGDYRVVYEVDDEALEVTVTRVAHRRDVYRRPNPT
jgi:mRNA interferase RelE/StbE